MRRKTKVMAWAVSPVLVVALLLAACGGGSDSNSEASSPPTLNGYVPVVPFDPIVNGTVLDGDTGTPVAGATVQADGASTTTDADGKFSLTLAVNPRLILSVSKTAYADTALVTEAVQSKRITILAQLLPVEASTTIDAAAGGTVTVPGSTARVVVPPASLVRTDGLPISGLVTVRVTPIDPSVNPAYMPGEYRGGGSTTSPIESYGAATVTLVDATGARVDVAPSMTATIRIPVGTRSATLPSTVPLFYFDAATGLWVQQGTASLGGTAPNRYYEGTVSHFSTWNADQYYDSINVTGCLKDDLGRRVSGARVVADGIDYSGTASAKTNSSGNFSVVVKKSAQAVLTAQNGTRYSNSAAVGPSTTDIDTTGDCLVVASDANGVNIRLTWGLRPLDVDSHLYTPNGVHIKYTNKGSLTAAPFAKLDVDDVNSFGPEVITLRRLMVGTYTYALHNYNGTFTPGITGSPTRVELNTASNARVFIPAAGEGANEWWIVFTMTVDAECGVTVTEVNTWASVEPSPPSGTLAYCTPPSVTVTP